MASEDDHANAVIVTSSVEGLLKFKESLRAKRVTDLWSINRDLRHSFGDLVANIGEVAGRFPCRNGSAWNLALNWLAHAASLRSVAGVEIIEQQIRALLAGGPSLVLGEGDLPAPCALGVYTSGSTGQPKLVGLTRDALIASAQASLKRINAKPGSTWSIKLPLTHIAGVQVVIRCILNQGRIVQSDADYTSIVPTQLVQALDGSPLLDELQKAKVVLLGGGRIDSQLLHDAKAQGINIVTTYGMSETSGGCVYDGIPLDGVEVDLESERIKIRGPVLAHSYVNDLAATTEHFKDGWFLTNDRGHFEDGRLVIDGRIDEVIVSGGENISLVAVETKLRTHPKIKDVICFGIPDRTWGEKLVAAVVVDGELSLNEVRDFMSEERFAAPQELHLLPELPRTGLGKPKRDELVRLFS